MIDYKNLFKDATTEELKLYYEQYLPLQKTGILADNELGKIRDEYCEFTHGGLHMMEQDLLIAIARNWYNVIEK